MKACDIMVSTPVVCRAESNLAVAAGLLWDHDCGALPVIDQANRPIGMITDRDICIAVGTRNKRAAEILVREVMTGKVFACDVSAEIHEALTCMKQNHVRRLIITERDRVKGILSIDDIILNVQWSDHKDVALSFLDVIRVLRCVTYPSPASDAACKYRALVGLGFTPERAVDKFARDSRQVAGNSGT